MAKLKKCSECSAYTLMENCPKCSTAGGVGFPTKQAHPPKYSKEDKYAAYRRKEKFG